MIAVLLAAALAGPHDERNHADLRWRTVETQHFRIHYPEGPRGLSGASSAQRLAHVAEDVWYRVGEVTGFFVEEPVHIVLIEHSDDLEGFTYPSWNVIVFSTDAGPELMRTRSRQDWLEDVLTHEFAHVASHKAASAFGEGANYGLELGLYLRTRDAELGPQVSVSDDMPVWWSEGGAEYWAQRAGTNWWSTSRDANLRVTALEGRLLSWDEQMTRRDKRDWGDGERNYVQGYAFASWLAERYDRDVLRDVAELSSKRWRMDPSKALEQVTRTDSRVLYEKWQAHVRAQYEGDQVALERLGRVEGAEVRQWDSTDHGYSGRRREVQKESSGTWDLYPRMADGWLAEHRHGWLVVRKIDPTLWPGVSGEHPHRGWTRLRRDESWRLQAWLPATYLESHDWIVGGESLVVVADHRTTKRRVDPHPGTSYKWLWRIDLRQTQVRRRVDGHWQKLPALRSEAIRRRMKRIPGTERARDPAAHGNQLAWIRFADGSENLVVGPVDGSDWRTVTAFDDGSLVTQPDWSPDGERLVVSLLRHDQNTLWLVDPDDGAMTPLTGGGADALDPHWGTDGWIYFSADPHGVFDVFRIRPEGGEVQQVTRVLGGAMTPALTDDGDLMYANQTAHGWKTWALARDEFLRLPTPGFDAVPNPEAFLAPVKVVERPTRPYRARRSLLPLNSAPQLRVDAVEDQLDVRSGAWVELKDALERHVLGVEALVGTDLLANGRYTFKRLPPDLSVWGHTYSDQGDRRLLLQAGGGRAVQRWSDVVRLRAGAMAWRRSEGPLEAQSTGKRVDLGGELGSLASVSQVDAWRVGWARGAWIRGWTDHADGAYTFDRVELSTAGALELPTFGVLDVVYRDRHALEFETFVGATSREVVPFEELRAGGLHPREWTADQLEETIPLPSHPAYALSGEDLVVVSTGYRLPLWRPRRKVGPAYVSGVHLRVGGGAASTDLVTVIPQVHSELRVGADLMGERWDSYARVAWSPDVPEGRLSVGIGTGR